MKKPDLQLHPNEPLREGLLRVAGTLVCAAVARVAHPTSDRGEDVHAVRTTIKRLRAMLRLVRPMIGETRFTRGNARLRHAARQISVTRDQAVTRRTLSALKKSARRESDREAFSTALRGLPNAAVPPARAEKAMRDVARKLQQMELWLHELPITARGWKAIEPGLQATYSQGRKRMEAAFSSGDATAFHKWRIRVKNLYYQLRLLEPIGPKRLGAVLTRLRKLQDKLGDDHDLAVAEGALRKAPDTFGGAEQVERVAVCLRKRSRKLRKDSEPLGQAIFRVEPRRFARRLGRRWKQWRKRG